MTGVPSCMKKMCISGAVVSRTPETKDKVIHSCIDTTTNQCKKADKVINFHKHYDLSQDSHVEFNLNGNSRSIISDTNEGEIPLFDINRRGARWCRG